MSSKYVYEKKIFGEISVRGVESGFTVLKTFIQNFIICFSFHLKSLNF